MLVLWDVAELLQVAAVGAWVQNAKQTMMQSVRDVTHPPSSHLVLLQVPKLSMTACSRKRPTCADDDGYARVRVVLCIAVLRRGKRAHRIVDKRCDLHCEVLQAIQHFVRKCHLQ